MMRHSPGLPNTALYLFACGVSLILSFWCAYSETVINPDGICYILSAQHLESHSVKEVLHLCPQSHWPFYPMLIYALAKLTPFSATVSAYVLNGLFSLLSVAAFLMLVKEMGGTGRVLWLAAFTILLSHDFNGLRQSIIRDHGYWACYLWSMWFLLRFAQKPEWSRALCWGVSLICATLFRKEGVVLMMTLPLSMLFIRGVPFTQRLRNSLQLYGLPLLLMLVAGVWLALHTTERQVYMSEVTAQIQFFSQTLHRYETLKEVFKRYAMVAADNTDLTIVVWLVISFWYLLNIINNLGWVFAGLITYLVLSPRRNGSNNKYITVISAYLIINLIITYLFQLEHEFLSKRYAMALSLALMLWVPFALDQLWHQYRRVFAGVMAAIIITALGGIFDFGYSKSYIHEAGDWMAANLPADARLYANDYQLMYYSRHFGADIFARIHEFTHIETIADGKWKQFDYLALRLSQSDGAKLNAVVREITLKPMRIFKNKRDDYVAVYKVSQEN